MKWIDPIVKEVRETREKLLEENNYDLNELCKKLKETQVLQGMQIVTKAGLQTNRQITKMNDGLNL